MKTLEALYGLADLQGRLVNRPAKVVRYAGGRVDLVVFVIPGRDVDVRGEGGHGLLYPKGVVLAPLAVPGSELHQLVSEGEGHRGPGLGRCYWPDAPAREVVEQDVGVERERMAMARRAEEEERKKLASPYREPDPPRMVHLFGRSESTGHAATACGKAVAGLVFYPNPGRFLENPEGEQCQVCRRLALDLERAPDGPATTPPSAAENRR